jgi:hypothetical protein
MSGFHFNHLNTQHHNQGDKVRSQSTQTKTPQATTGIFALLRGLLHAQGSGARILGGIGARIAAQVPPVFASVSGFLLIRYTAQTHITVEVLFHVRTTTARAPGIAHLAITATQRFALAILAMGSLGALALPVAAQAETAAPGWELSSAVFPTHLAQPVDEEQELTVSATAGTFTLFFEGSSTASIKYNAPAAGAGSVQEALEALPSIGAGNVTVTGGPEGGVLKPYVIAFTNALAGKTPGQMFPNSEQLELNGGGPESGSAFTTVKTAGAPSGALEVDVYNIGAAKSSGPVTVTDELPAGVVAIEAGDVQQTSEGGPVHIGTAGLWDCSGSGGGPVAGATVVKCTNDPVALPSLPLPAGTDATANGSSAIAEIGISVRTQTSTPGTLTNRVSVAGGGGAAASTESTVVVNKAPASAYGVQSVDGWASNADGTLDTQAGSHPYELFFSFNLDSKLNAEGELAPAGGNTRNVTVNLPPGPIGNPTAVPQCKREEFNREECNPTTEVGVIVPNIFGGFPVSAHLAFPIYNVVPPPGAPAAFGFSIAGQQVFLEASVRSGGDYGITVHARNLTVREGTLRLLGARAILWGEPADHSHDEDRDAQFWDNEACNNERQEQLSRPVGCVSEAPNVPFLTLGGSCEGPVSASLVASTWETEEQASMSFLSHDANFNPSGFTGCDHLRFATSVSVQPDTADADTPAGLTVDVRVPQEGLVSPGALATSNIKDTTVTLPAGVVINPGQAAGLQACQPGPAGDDLPLPGEDGEEERFAKAASCPSAAKIGEDEIETPLLSKPLKGDVYILQSNPPHLKMLVTASGEGVNLKLVGDVELCETVGQVIEGKSCEAPGQLITTFKETPELPFTNFKLAFSGGAQAALDTPTQCGTYTTTSDFTPWSTTAVGDVFPTSSFAIDSGPNGTGCPSAQLPFTPSLTAGATTDEAGSFTGFSMLLQSGDGQQRIDKLSFAAPPGLSGYLSNVPLCEEPQAAEGACPADTQIGHSTVASGPGPYPLTIPQPGDPESPIYLTGPYEGAPFGLTIVTHVIAGPFNLGNVITRAKIEINPYTTQLTVTTNPLPQVIDGVPTDLRLVDAVIDRSNFMINPTNCASSSFSGTANGAPPPGSSGTSITASLSSHFQVGACQSLKFGPKFAVSTSGKTSKADGASLHVHLTYPSGTPGTYTNIAKVKVELPKALPSRLTTLQKACTAAQFDSNPSGCPPASIIGQAKAISPIIPVPLVGPAYFVSHGGEAFPSLVMVLQGYGVTLDLVGTTFISKAGITSSTFKTVPDQPVGSFELTLPQGKFSALAANGKLCTQKLTMPTEFVGQNGSEIHVATPISVSGCKPAITVVSHQAKGDTAIITASVPAAGKLTATGTDLSKGTAKISKAGDVTVKLTLTKAGTALLRKRKGRTLQAKVRLTFIPKKGAKLKTTVTVLVGGKS